MSIYLDNRKIGEIGNHIVVSQRLDDGEEYSMFATKN